MNALLLVLTLMFVAPPSAPQEPAPEAQDETVLDPGALPRAEAGSWEGWVPDRPPSELARERFIAASVANARGEVLLSLEHLFAVLRAEPDYPAALYQAGVAYFRLQRYGDAATLLERYVEVVPARVGDTRALAHCYYTLGRYAEARAHYERVLVAREVEDVEALFGLALCHLRLFETERGLELLRRVLELDPRHAEAAVWVVQVLHEQGELEPALAASERALELAAYLPRPWFLRARILFELGRDDEAEAAHERFVVLDRVDQEVRRIEGKVDLDPRRSELHTRLVELHRLTGNRGALRAVFERWLILQPTDAALRVHALDVFEAEGDLAAARAAAAELARVAPSSEDPAVWRRLARWYARTRERVKQIEAEDRARELTR